MDFIQKHKLKFLIGVLLVVLVMIIRGGVANWKSSRVLETEDYSYLQDDTYVLSEPVRPLTSFEEERNLLFDSQEDLEIKFGLLPDGFMWDFDGTLLSVGDKSMSVEDVLYAYFRAVASLDIGTVQRYTRGSSLVKRYSSYFDATSADYDYDDQFIRNMYKECMLSLQIGKVLSTSIFADNKVVFTVEAKILDLTDKSFWKDDRIEIYKNLYLYSSEDDRTKQDIYLYDYILEHYRSDEALLRDVVFDITCQKYTDVDSGWLISIDTDVDNACVYKDGNLVVSYIKTAYQEEAYDLFSNEDGTMMSYDQVLNGNFDIDSLGELPNYVQGNNSTYDERGNLTSGNGVPLDRSTSSYNGDNLPSVPQSEQLISIEDYRGTQTQSETGTTDSFLGNNGIDYSSSNEFEISSYDEFN